MHAIAQFIEPITCGRPQNYQNLTVTPLLNATTDVPGYWTLDEAFTNRAVRATEIPEVANVSEIYLENHSERAVLFMDGEELVGAMQNRVLNVSVLARPFETLTAPVSCVEPDRWSASTPGFRSESRAFYATGRARKAQQVTDSMCKSGSKRSCQHAIWDDIGKKAERMGCQTHSGAMSVMYEEYGAVLDAYTDVFEWVPHQVGVIFRINDQLRGLDLFDSPDTTRKLMPKLIQSYALDAIDNWHDVTPKLSDSTFLRIAAEAPIRSFPSLGECEDIRFTSRRVVGGALSAQDRIIHLAAFLPTQGPPVWTVDRRDHMA